MNDSTANTNQEHTSAPSTPVISQPVETAAANQSRSSDDHTSTQSALGDRSAPPQQDLAQQRGEVNEHHYSSGGSNEDEFPEITPEEVEIWSRVERKRFHYRSCVQRDEHLLRHVLLLRPFQATTAKERADKWQLVATRCDQSIKSVPENATGVYNFHFGHHAQQRFKVLMEAHYGLLNNSSNPMFISIYGEYSSIRSLMEKAYDAYWMAGGRPGKNAAFTAKSPSPSQQSNKRHRAATEQESIEEVVGSPLKKLCNESKEILTSVTTILNRQQDLSKDWSTKQQEITADTLASTQRLLERKLNHHVQVMEEVVRTVDKERLNIRENLDGHEQQLAETLAKQQKWMEDWQVSQQSRQEEWTELYKNWMGMQKEMASMLRQLVEMQNSAESNRMAFLREVFGAKKP